MGNGKTISKSIFTFLVCIIAFSCERQTLENEYSQTIALPVHIDWSIAKINPQNVSLLIYDKITKNLITEHCFANNEKEIQTTVYLPAGRYTVVAINEIRDQIDYVRVSGFDKFSTLKAYPVKSYQELKDEYSSLYLSEPGILAFAVIKDLDLTGYKRSETTYLSISAKNAFENSKEKKDKSIIVNKKLMNIVAQRLVGRCEVNIYIKNIKSARFPILANLRNLSTGYVFEKDENEQKFGAFRFEMTENTKFWKNDKVGVVVANFATFGLSGNRFTASDQPPKRPVMLDLMIMLTDKQKTIRKYSLDVTDKISVLKENNGAFCISIVDTLQKSLPSVEIKESNESGFQVNHSDWNEVNVILHSP